MEKYKVSSEGIEIEVEITKTNDFVFHYNLKIPEIGQATQILLNKIKTILLAEVPIKPAEVIDPTKSLEIKNQVKEKAFEIIKKEIPNVNEETRKILLATLIQEMFGLGKLEFLIEDPNLEEIVINGSKVPVWVYHKKYGWLKTNIFVENENEIYNYASSIARKIGRQITLLNPLLDAHLPSGDRVNATLFPVSSFGNTITIRKFRRNPWTITELIQNKTLNYEITSLIWLAIQYELNMIVAGGTASGKTTLLNVFTNFIQPNHRIVSIEDSVSGEEEVLLKENGRIRRIKIKDLFENKSSDEIISPNIEVLSMNKLGKIEFKKVKKFIRHKVKKPLYKIILTSGKTIKVTGDHSLFSLDENLNIVSVKAVDLKKGSYIVTPRYLELPENISEIDLLEFFKDNKDIFVKGESIKKFLIKEIPTEFINKRRVYRIKDFLPIKLFEKIKDKIENNNLYIFKRGSKLSLPSKLKIDEDFAFLLGYWIGSGYYDKNGIIITISEKEVLERLRSFCKKYRLKLKKHSDGFSYLIICSLLRDIMIKLGFDENPFSKRIPEIVFNLKKNLKSEFLKGLFSARGWVSDGEVKLVTHSEALNKDLESLLLNFSIVSLAYERKDKNGKNYFELRISGNFLKDFASSIGFVQESKRVKLNKLLERELHSFLDVIPLSPEILKELKASIKTPITSRSWYRGYLTRNYLKGLVEENFDKVMLIKNPLDGNKIVNLVNNDVFWDRVKEIEEIEYEGYVYDLSVEDNENFVCNNILAHNTRELQLSEFLHWVPLTTREPNPEGLGEVSMLDLLVNSLRMRPDRIIVGEIRRAREAEVLFEAMHTGHSVYATLHADSAEQALKRLTNPPINVPETLMEALHLIAVGYRDRRSGKRRLFQLAEVIGGEKGVKVNVFYKWKPAKDVIERDGDIYRIFEEIRLVTGMSDEEIEKDLKEKEEILKYFVRNDLKDLNKIGRIVSIYYTDKDLLMKNLSKKPDEIIKKFFESK